MANPQLENGYLRIATDIMDALIKTRIPGEARQLLDFIIRKTYGWNKKSDSISLSQIMEATGLLKTHVIRAREKLIKMALIIVTQKGNETYPTYCFNKHFETWKALPKKITLPKKVICVTRKGNLPLPKKVPTIDTSTIDNTKDIITRFETIWSKYPNKDGKKESLKHFKSTVKDNANWDGINKALENYIKHLSTELWKKPKNGSTWFNNWKDWVDWKEPKIHVPSPKPREPMPERIERTEKDIEVAKEGFLAIKKKVFGVSQ